MVLGKLEQAVRLKLRRINYFMLRIFLFFVSDQLPGYKETKEKLLNQDRTYPYGSRHELCSLVLNRRGPSTIGLPMDLAMDLSMP